MSGNYIRGYSDSYVAGVIVPKVGTAVVESES